jgi:hypothetical protein
MKNLAEHSSPNGQTPPSSGATPFYLGIALAIAFAIGLAIGFLGRPMVIQDVPIEVVVTVVPNTNSSEAITRASTPTSGLTSSADTSPTTGPTDQPNTSSDKSNAVDPPSPELTDGADSARPTPTLMDFVMADARHIQGNDNAPVTIVEFSDFK